MAGLLNMSNNKITNLKPTDDKDGVNKKYIDDNYLKLSGGGLTGTLSVPDLDRNQRYTVIRNNVLNYYSLNRFYFSQRGGRLGSLGGRTG